MINYSKTCWVLIVGLCACTFTSSPSSDAAGSRLIRNTAGTNLADIDVSSDAIIVDLPSGTLRGETKRSDKRKYYDGGTMVYAVKMSDDGFKLRDKNEELLWKIKLYPDKLKIANNEEMTGAYEVKLRDEGRVKLERYEKEITTIQLNDTAEWLTIAEKYSIQGFGTSLAPGILLINDLKDSEKFVIMAELAQRNR